ncbi:uncharacterized protein EI90DRAFT_2081881 [Cantharellus anzutake]|uniref:uncharacterized protein n=1 Tax=Cantharellus anzutake TaxID=1750568 RepID=UPI0019087B94|nr:uncharacterized protein EI90DRAFT_2081881 [Cantharellus anzutake]KAF8340550.1 hypothetical protein EI90DRAFT_2081881 [Cantharellus anzutake]
MARLSLRQAPHNETMPGLPASPSAITGRRGTLPQGKSGTLKYTPLSKLRASLDSSRGRNPPVQGVKRERDDTEGDQQVHASQKRRVLSQPIAVYLTAQQAFKFPTSVDAHGNEDNDGDGHGKRAGAISLTPGHESSSPSEKASRESLVGDTEDTATADGENAFDDPPILRTNLVESSPDSSPEPDEVLMFLSQKSNAPTPSTSQRDKERREVSARAAQIAKVEPDDCEVPDASKVTAAQDASNEPLLPKSPHIPPMQQPLRCPPATPIRSSSSRDPSVEIIERPSTRPLEHHKPRKITQPNESPNTRERTSLKPPPTYRKSDLFW